MKCQFCKPPEDVKEWDKKKVEHLIVTQDMNDHFHVHGPIDNKPIMKKFLEEIQNHTEITIPKKSKTNSTTCQYCGSVIGDGDAGIREHLITTIDNHNHVHVHGPLENKVVLEEMVDAICAHGEIGNPTCRPPTATATEEVKVPDKVVFHNRQAIGDILTMTCLYYTSPVLLANGKTEMIGKIVNNKKNVSVLSFNKSKKIFENKKVTNWIKHDIGKHEWYFVTYKSAPTSQVAKRGQGVYLTEDHKIFTNRGMVRVDQVVETDKILTNEKALNKKQRELFIGTILGDSSLRRVRTVGRAYFNYTHAESQLEFVCLKDKGMLGFEYSNYYAKGGQKHGSYHQDCITSQYRASVEFGELQKKWYKNKKKVVPPDLNENDFSLLTLAVWYMDDGSITNGNAAVLCTESFSKDENQFLADILNKKFNLNVTLQNVFRSRENKRWKDGIRLYIGNGRTKENSADRFFKSIAPYIPETMRYKLPSQYRNIKYNPKLWELGVADFYYATPVVEKKKPRCEGHSRYIYCLEVEDNHNFVSNNMIFSNCAVRDFKLAFPETEVGVTTTALHIWDNNPNINWDLTKEALDYRAINGKQHEMVQEIGPGYLTNKSNMWNYHMCNAFRMSLEQKLNISIPQTTIRPDIYMTEEEYNRPPLIEGPYWVVVVGGEPGWGAKCYPAERFQEVIDTLKDKIQFVQLGVKSHPWAHLENVINYIGKTEDKHTGIRDLFNIFLHAQGSLSLVSMAMHLSAAFNNPATVIAGAREPFWFTHYMGQQYLQTNGCLPCAETSACWKCKLEGCMEVQKRHGMEPQDKIPPCVDIIHPQEVVTAIRKYYDGGRLKYGEKIKNKFFKNIVKESKIYVPGPPVKFEIKSVDEIDLKFGGADITEKDWMFIERILKETKFSRVLQFGLGITTSLFIKYCDEIVIYETDKSHSLLEDYKRHVGVSKLKFKFWDGKELPEESELGKFDLVFVDGPPGGGSREVSTRISTEHTDVLLIHDENRKEEKMWREKYVKDKFVMKQKGGNRTAIWERTDGVVIPHVKINLVSSTEVISKEDGRAVTTSVKHQTPKVRLISTARGWGGCARSITTIMKFLIDAGHYVEFVPFHSKYELGKGIGGEFANCLSTTLKDVAVRDWSAITEPCEVLLVYTDDYVFEFPNPDLAKVFENVRADRKLMFINYRLGKVGQVPWTQGWDEYGALNLGLIEKLVEAYPEAKKTSVMPPCVDLTPFFSTVPKYDGILKLIRHSSQGNAKFYKDSDDWYNEINSIIDTRKDIQFHFMPGPDYAKDDGEYIIKYKKNHPPVPEFLALGNCFYYSLANNPKYQDSGPRVIIEAMASGLSVLADNWGGAVDRLTPETGWLFDKKEDYIKVIKELTPEILKEKGEAAKQRVIDNWAPEKWINYILGI